MTKVKKPTKKRQEEKKLKRAVNTLASIIDSVATSMKGEIDGGETCDLKQLKELTGACKELSGLISSIEEQADDSDSSSLTVIFEGESGEWAK